MSDNLVGAREQAPIPQDLREWRVLVPSGGESGARIAAQIEDRGGAPVVAALIRSVPPADPASLEAAVRQVAEGKAYEWLVLTSRRTVRALHDAGLSSMGHAPVGMAASEAQCRLACVGRTTADAAAEQLHITADLVPDQQSARGLLEAFPHRQDAAGHTSGVAEDNPSTGRVLLPQSAQAHDALRRGLTALGWQVDAVTAYRTIGVALSQQAIEDVRRGAIDAVLLTSGTVAQQVAIQFGASAMQTALVSIGEQTTNDAEALGLRVDATAVDHSIPGMLDALAALAERQPRRSGATTISRAPSISGSATPTAPDQYRPETVRKQ